LRTDMECPQKKPRTQALASFSRARGSSLGSRTNVEESGSAHRPYVSSVGISMASGPATIRGQTASLALAARAFGFGVGRALLPLSRKRLGLVSDGGQTVPPKSSRLPGSSASAREGELVGLVSGDHDDPYSHTQTHPGYGLRRGCGNYQARQEPGLDRSALPFPSHQPIAELPRPTKSPLGWQTLARSSLPTYSTGSRSHRRSPFGNRAQRAEASRASSNRIACYTHDRSGVSQADRPFPSLSEISRAQSANHYRERGMGRRVRDLMRQTRSISSPQALQLWAIALIRMRPTVMCNGKHFQQNFFV
jgi:hypothetical protein